MRLLPLALLLACSLRAGDPPAPLPAPAAAPTPLPLGSLVGAWKGTDGKGVTAVIEMDAEGFATLVMKGERLGGRPAGGPNLHYRVDASHTPAWIDFVLVSLQGQELARLRGVVERLGPEEIRLRLDFNGGRFEDFQGATPDTCLTLRRQP